MTEPYTKKITITLPTQLIKQLDNLVLHDLSNRSAVIRQALWEYIRQPQNEIVANPESIPIKRMLEAIEEDFPDMDPNDHELIKFFYKQKVKGEL
jgi:metal-responsive CopG/Arc/MetJ family transcriptional regulator